MILEFKIDDEHFAKYNEETKEYDFFHNNILIPRKNDKLFKFYFFNTNTIDSLLNSYFFLANPATFNDPFDSNRNLIVDYKEEIDTEKNMNHFEDIGITSFCEDINNPIMWAHYTNNYRGIAIEFDTSNFKLLIEKDQFVGDSFKSGFSINKVIYVNYITPIQKAFKFYKRYLFATKGKYWQVENEWRIIGELNKEKINRRLKFNPSILKTVYVGYNLFNEDKTAISLIKSIIQIKYPSAKIYVVKPDKINLKLTVERIN